METRETFYSISMFFFPDIMVGMGFTREEIRDSLNTQKYNEVTATYLLLGRKNDVSVIILLLLIISEYNLCFETLNNMNIQSLDTVYLIVS